KALQTEDVETPLGKIKFDAKGDATGIGFSVYKIEKGVFVEQK
ncbi:MAG: branched-chain amino acid ABC transporter substrate-binding protein, partial [Desulfamplus sp.]|nr:branched-chain amino acid ABC transporter substrate-binding protein [Desulfamplus sp.]